MIVVSRAPWDQTVAPYREALFATADGMRKQLELWMVVDEPDNQ
jgi:hypothetical protein